MEVERGLFVIPGNGGRDCPGNGTLTIGGKTLCLCDECGWFLCCEEDKDPDDCLTCRDAGCPRAGGRE